MLAHVLQRRICVIQLDEAGNAFQVFVFGAEYSDSAPLHVVFDGVCHYDALVPVAG